MGTQKMTIEEMKKISEQEGEIYRRAEELEMACLRHPEPIWSLEDLKKLGDPVVKLYEKDNEED